LEEITFRRKGSVSILFCPQCGQRLGRKKVEEHERQLCDAEVGGCGFIDYGHFTLGVGGVVLEPGAAGERRVLLIERNIEPNRGGWTIPGGYVERDETAEQAVIREVEEETGLRCKLVGLAGYRNRADPDMNTSYVVFLLEAIGGKLFSEPTVETAQVGFYTLSEMKVMPRLTPLSLEFAVAAVTGSLKILPPKTMPNWNNRPPFTMFMGTEGREG
jgi:ADP-ribose pyrophosphatase YjhB (NUDIX family)